MTEPEFDSRSSKEDPETDPDGFLPNYLRRYLPTNPNVRDGIMLVLAITLSGALAILALSYFDEWVGVLIMSVGIAYFTVRYWARIWVRYYSKKRMNGHGG